MDTNFIKYSYLLPEKNTWINLDRKILADLAVKDSHAFKKLAEIIKK